MKDFKVSWINLVCQSNEFDIIKAESEAEAIQKLNDKVKDNENELVYDLKVNAI